MEIRPIFETSKTLFADQLMFDHLNEMTTSLDRHSTDDYERGKVAMLDQIVENYNFWHDKDATDAGFAWQEFVRFLRKQKEATRDQSRFSAGEKAIVDEARQYANECTFEYDPNNDPEFNGDFSRKDVIGVQQISDDLETLILEAETRLENGRNHRLNAD